MAEKQPTPKDPIQTRSMSKPIFVATAILLGSLALAMYDEFIWRRPYKKYQEAYVNVYANYLQDGLLPKQQIALSQITSRPEYQALVEQKTQADAAATIVVESVQKQITRIAGNIERMSAALKDARALFGALTYQYDNARTEDEKKAKWDEMTAVKTSRYPVTVVNADGSTTDLTPNFDELAALVTKTKDEKGLLEKQKADASSEGKRIQRVMDAMVAKDLIGPHPDTVSQILRLTDDRMIGPSKTTMGMDLPTLPNGEIMQINIEQANWVDRCESCHVGIREPIDLTPELLMKHNEGLSEEMAKAFVSHPSRVLLEVHDPETFGCSTCHNGNGRSLTEVKLAHGMNKHWLYPLFAPENYEAGCVQCHRSDVHLKVPGNPAKMETRQSYEAKVFNQGRWLFQWKGCIGCHKYEGYDTEKDHITAIEKEMRGLETRRAQLLLARTRSEDTLEKSAIDQQVAVIDTRVSEKSKEVEHLEMERQKVGPDLTYLKAKLTDKHMAWLPSWLEDPHKFRPSTKMPKFRYEPGDVLAISAYLWQNSDKPMAPKHPMGDTIKGKHLFENRGCLACHTVQRDGAVIGDGFAADLSRMGDKADYDYIVEWVKHPTNGVMPSLRLSDEDSQNIAAYLMTLSSGKVDYMGMGADELASKLNDAALAEQGKSYIRHYGCAGCHTIKGLEEEGRIGVELTKEGSVPKERLDFGRKEHDFKHSGRYNHKYYFETKLATPAFFGTDKHYDNVRDKLKMPSFWPEDYKDAHPQHEAVVPNEEINALTTFLLGSVESFRADSMIPESLKYKPSDSRKAIQEGWWIVKKYNCVGCHQFETDTEPSYWQLENFTGSENLPKRPPTLVGQGFRTQPNWLAKFLKNPALSDKNVHANGVRFYLETRMPSFRMSDREIAKLVAFFDALSEQPTNVQEPELTPVVGDEEAIARAIFKRVQCYNCHARGAADPEYDLKNANAPNLTLVKSRLKSGWHSRWLERPSSFAPGTAMPANFFWESDVKLRSGATLRVVKYTPNEADGDALALDPKTFANLPKIKLADVESVTNLRMVITGSEADPIPAEIAAYPGDHRELTVRYLHLIYDAAEIPRTLPPK